MKQLISYLKSKFGKTPSTVESLDTNLLRDSVDQAIKKQSEKHLLEKKRVEIAIEKAQQQFNEGLFKGLRSSKPRFPFVIHTYFEADISKDIYRMIAAQNQYFQDNNIKLVVRLVIGSNASNDAIISVNLDS